MFNILTPELTILTAKVAKISVQNFATRKRWRNFNKTKIAPTFFQSGTFADFNFWPSQDMWR